MSTDQIIYIGVYYRVYMPDETIPAGVGLCRREQHKCTTPYCPHDGSKVDYGTYETKASFSDFCKSAFGEEDLFSSYDDESGYIIVLANRINNQPGNAYIGKGESEIPAPDYSGDWERLEVALAEHNIKFERKFGVYTYWS